MKVFISYAHEDESYKNELERHLSNLRRSGKVTTWNDRRIKPGEEWDKEIHKELKNSDLILLLVSSDFIDSDYCFDIEVKKAVEYHNNNEKIVVPVIIRFCDWSDTPFGKIQPLPTDAIPIDSKEWNTDDEAYLDVINGIKKLLQPNNEEENIIEIKKEEEPKIEVPPTGGKAKKSYIISAGIVIFLLIVFFLWIYNRADKTDKELRKQIEQLQAQMNAEKMPADEKNGNITGEGFTQGLTYWNKGDTINIAFMGGSEDLKEFIKITSLEWLASGELDLYFEFDDNASTSDVRISFTETDGSWSFVGRDALSVEKKSPTMNFGYLKSVKEENEKRQNVLHEFGHMLGLIHEHQSPAIAKELNWDIIYSHFNGPPNYWSREEIKDNFKTLNENDVYYKNKPFDEASVMLYKFPPAIFKNLLRIVQTGDLSEGDKKIVKAIYKKG